MTKHKYTEDVAHVPNDIAKSEAIDLIDGVFDKKKGTGGFVIVANFDHMEGTIKVTASAHNMPLGAIEEAVERSLKNFNKSK